MVSTTRLSGARLDREFRRVAAGRREHRSTLVGRAAGYALGVAALVSFLAWATVASLSGMVRILTGG